MTGIQNRAEEEVDDVFYTPAEIAVMMVEMAELKPGDIVLEPCRGGGIIYRLIPDYCTKEWCEVAEGRDFFEYTGRPTHIITNPPFSLFTKFVIKMIELKPQTITLLFGCMNMTLNRINLLIDAGYTITKEHHTWWKPIPFAFTVIIQFELLAEPRDTADLTYDHTLHN